MDLVQQTIDMMNALDKQQKAMVLMHVPDFQHKTLKSGKCRFMYTLDRKPSRPKQPRRARDDMKLRHIR